MPPLHSETFILFENAAGYLLFLVNEWDSIVQDVLSVQHSFLDFSKFRETVTLRAIQPFTNAETALMACEAAVSGEVTPLLNTFLQQNLPKKKKRYFLGVIDPALAKNLSALDFPVMVDKNILELTRLLRVHNHKFMKAFGSVDLSRFQVGLGHRFSRTKIRLDPRRQDKPVQNAVALIENLDKAINTFAMRVREWYSWHFPELGKIVTDQIKFAQIAKVIRMKETFSEDRKPEIVAILDGDEALADEILHARDASMGQEIVEIDMMNIENFANQLVILDEQRTKLIRYLADKLESVAPNLQALVGDILAAKLIAHAGSLTNLSKYPASTVQILGAEKALFRAMKTKGKTPKYGLLFQSSFIGRAAIKNKGRISRYLANKCSLASRIDNFATTPCRVFGDKMRDQIEQRLNHLTDGIITRKNLDVMREATAEYEEKVKLVAKKKKKEEKKARKLKELEKQGTESDSHMKDEEVPEPEKKRKSKDKRARRDSADVNFTEGTVIVKKSKKVQG